MRPKFKIILFVLFLVVAGAGGLLALDMPAPSAPTEQTVTLPAAL